MMPKSVAAAIMITLSLSLLFLFQNCSDVSFTEAESIITESPVGPQCDSGMTLVNGICQSLNSTFTQCMSFEELSDQVEIPSLESSGRCFYVKLLSELPLGPSGSRGEEVATDVLARKHGNDPRPSTPAGTTPFVLGDEVVELLLQGSRNLSLTSSSVGDINALQNYKLRVDNFILVEMATESSYKTLARGTADSQPAVHAEANPKGQILLQNMMGEWAPVTDFVSYAPGGTALVDVISLGEVDQGLLQIRTRMLDCGGSAYASDMYLVIH